MGPGNKLTSEFTAVILTVISPLVGVGALWALARTCISGLFTQPSLGDLEKSCAGAISRFPSDWQKLKRLRSFLHQLTLFICTVVLLCLVLSIWLQVLDPIPKAKDGVTLVPNTPQVLACIATVIIGVMILILYFLWEARMRVHKEQIEKLRKS